MSPESAPVHPASGEPARKQAPSRIPNFKAFLVTGAILGLAVGVFFGLREPGGPSYTTSTSYDPASAMGYLGAFGAMLGAGVAAVLALVLERVGRR